MFWNIRWKNANSGNMLMYVGLRAMHPAGFVLHDPNWLKTHSSNSRYGAKFFTSAEKSLLQKTWTDLPEGFAFVCGSMRYKDALAVDQGAVNIQAIGNSLAAAAKEVGDQQVGTAKDDPAILLLVTQLAYLCQIGSGGLDMSRYSTAKDICKEMCAAGGIRV